eukprot:COSAG01_NODE_4629_length_4863_cov_4.778967_5_plen_71_part_00
MYWLHQQLDPLIAARHIPACEALLRRPHGADGHSSVTEGLARLCAGRFHLGIGRCWLRFAYVLPVLVTKV